MKKFNLIPVFFAVIMAVFFFASCEKEVMTDVAGVQNTGTDLQKQPLNQTATNLQAEVAAQFPEGQYKKQVSVPDASRAYTFTFEVASNSRELLAQFDQSSISVELSDYDAGSDPKGAVAHHEEEEPSSNTNAPLAKRKFISVNLVGLNTPVTISEIPIHRVTFSGKLLSVLQRENAATAIDFGPVTVEEGAARATYTLWNNNKWVKMWGNCSVYTYRAYTSSSTSYYHHSHGVYSFSQCDVCCPSYSSMWIRKIVTVGNTALSSYQAMQNTCSGIYGDYCW